jgi:Uma2 family endonuclease
MPLKLERRRFTADEYFAMADAGILREDERVELIEGEIIRMTPIGSRHAASVTVLTHLLVEQAGKQAIVRVQNPVRLGDITVPQPDVAVYRARDDYYAGAHPRPEDTLLVIEVSVSTLPYDQGKKLPLYAASGVQEVWIVDLDGDVINVYREPRGRRYEVELQVRSGGVLTPAALPSVTLPADRILV